MTLQLLYDSYMLQHYHHYLCTGDSNFLPSFERAFSFIKYAIFACSFLFGMYTGSEDKDITTDLCLPFGELTVALGLFCSASIALS
mmetsp:Transcript_24780/g.32047  ORF Transcript_24780/g.32047 Transcript_24780/m.32047 type:complete len:86 (-) Transcript_24780:262-519(-)